MWTTLLLLFASRSCAQTVELPAPPVAAIEVPAFDVPSKSPLESLGAAPDVPRPLAPYVDELDALLERRDCSTHEFSNLLQSSNAAFKEKWNPAKWQSRFVSMFVQRAFNGGSTELLPRPDHVHTAAVRRAAAQALADAFWKGWGAPEKEQAAFGAWSDVLSAQKPVELGGEGLREYAFDSHATARATSMLEAHLQPVLQLSVVVAQRPEIAAPSSFEVLLDGLRTLRAVRDFGTSAPADWPPNALARLKAWEGSGSQIMGALEKLSDRASALIPAGAASALRSELEHWATDPRAPAEESRLAEKVAYRLGALSDERALVLREDLAPAPQSGLEKRIGRLRRLGRVIGLGQASMIGTTIGVVLSALILYGVWPKVPAVLVLLGLGEAAKRLAARRRARLEAGAAREKKALAALVDDEYLATLKELDEEFPAALALGPKK